MFIWVVGCNSHDWGGNNVDTGSGGIIPAMGLETTWQVGYGHNLHDGGP